MEQSPLRGNTSSASQEIPHILCNPNVHYRVHKSSPLICNLTQTNPVHASSPILFLIICFNIIVPSLPRSSKCCLLLGFPHQNPVHTFHVFHMCYVLPLSFFFYFIAQIMFDECFLSECSRRMVASSYFTYSISEVVRITVSQSKVTFRFSLCVFTFKQSCLLVKLSPTHGMSSARNNCWW
jgi:hypothetical protein